MRLHPCMTTSYGISVRQAGTLPVQLVCSCTSSFFQIPPCDGHPCLRLTIPTAKFVVVFHHLAIAHAGHTYLKTRALALVFMLFCTHADFTDSTINFNDVSSISIGTFMHDLSVQICFSYARIKIDGIVIPC